VLLNEDGRGIALNKVISGVMLDAYERCIKNKAITAFHKAGVPYDNYIPARGFVQDLGACLSTRWSMVFAFINRATIYPYI